MSQLSNQSLGKLGEDISVKYLRRNGYTILDRNFKVRYGEIDIIATKDAVLVFVEVKTRGNTLFGTPEEAVTPRKLREVVKTAELYKGMHNNLAESLRIDVIAIQLKGNTVISFHHIQNVTL